MDKIRFLIRYVTPMKKSMSFFYQFFTILLDISTRNGYNFHMGLFGRCVSEVQTRHNYIHDHEEGIGCEV